MKYAIIAALALTGCTTTDIDQAIRGSLPQICAASSGLYETYMLSGSGSDRDRASIEAAWSAMEPLCDDAPNATAAKLATAIAQAAVIVRIVRRAS